MSTWVSWQKAGTGLMGSLCPVGDHLHRATEAAQVTAEGWGHTTHRRLEFMWKHWKRGSSLGTGRNTQCYDVTHRGVCVWECASLYRELPADSPVGWQRISSRRSLDARSCHFGKTMTLEAMFFLRPVGTR